VLLSRQALHAHRITFTHPVSRAPVTAEAPLPPDMQRVLEALRAR
jgi:23S rRNA pseudouridine1911/1915/1917 synthase